MRNMCVSRPDRLARYPDAVTVSFLTYSWKSENLMGEETAMTSREWHSEQDVAV